MVPVSRTIDRYEASFDHDGLIANAGLVVVAKLMSRLGLERLANQWVRTGSPVDLAARQQESEQARDRRQSTLDRPRRQP